MTSNKVKNAEQQNKHKETLMEDLHNVEIWILNYALMSW